MDKKELWTTVLETLKINLSPANFSTWFPKTFIESVKPLDDRRDLIQIGCPSAFIRNTIEDRYYGQLKEIIEQITKKKSELAFIVKPGAIDKEKDSPAPLFEPAAKPSLKPLPTHPLKQPSLNPTFLLENYVVGSSNNLAHAAAEGIVNNPGQAYNPFFIYGGVGVGKTHLMQAVGHAINQKDPTLKVLYVTAETFTNDLIDSLQNKTTQKFKKKYRQIDCLLIDDIQFIAGKESTQEEFFHTFNALYMQGRQIIMTADRRPEQLGNIKDRLISRFMGGLTVDIQLPNYEMRVAILKQKCQHQQCEVGERELELIAAQVQSNIRELEGALSQILARARASNQPITTDFISQFFGVKKKEQLTNITPKKVLSAVARAQELRVKDITGQSRKAHIAKARQIAMYLMRKDLELPLIHIGRLFGDRDHTTVMHSVEKIERLFTTNQDLRHEVLSLRTNLFSH